MDVTLRRLLNGSRHSEATCRVHLHGKPFKIRYESDVSRLTPSRFFFILDLQNSTFQRIANVRNKCSHVQNLLQVLFKRTRSTPTSFMGTTNAITHTKCEIHIMTESKTFLHCTNRRCTVPPHSPLSSGSDELKVWAIATPKRNHKIKQIRDRISFYLAQ